MPFLIMIVVNELIRPTIKIKPNSMRGISVINPVDKVVGKCSWVCSSNTSYCKENHVKYLKPYFGYTDVLYKGLIGLLFRTGNYGLANIVFLVVLVPLLLWFLLIKSLNIQDEINKQKKENE